ncbi:MAG: universal stress protein [Dehalococcoidia bacterium]
MFTNILVALDGSELAEQALPVARDLAGSSNATIHLIQVVSRQPELEAARGGGDFGIQAIELERDLAHQLVEARISRAKTYLEGIAVQLQSEGFQAETTIGEGAAAENIVNYSREHGIDLVVMSSHGHGGVKRLLLGSVTDGVIRSCEAPVLVLPCS